MHYDTADGRGVAVLHGLLRCPGLAISRHLISSISEKIHGLDADVLDSRRPCPRRGVAALVRLAARGGPPGADPRAAPETRSPGNCVGALAWRRYSAHVRRFEAAGRRRTPSWRPLGPSGRRGSVVTAPRRLNGPLAAGRLASRGTVPIAVPLVCPQRPVWARSPAGSPPRAPWPGLWRRCSDVRADGPGTWERGTSEHARIALL